MIFGLLPLTITDLRAQVNPELFVKEDKQWKVQMLEKKMLEAHGGYKLWKEAPSLSFINEAYDFSISSTDDISNYVDIYNYKIAIKPGNSTGYALFTGEKRSWIFFDGREIGSVGLVEENNNLKKSPAVLLFSVYALINLPWLTQLDGVKLKYVGTGRLPLEPGKYDIIKMSFDVGNHNHEGFYELYIDPDSGLLKAVRQTAIFPKLPGTNFNKGVSDLPVPILHVFKSYRRSSGLTVPTSFVSYLNRKLLAVHFIQSPSFNEPIREEYIYFSETNSRETPGSG
jgi:hypothetical protein